MERVPQRFDRLATDIENRLEELEREHFIHVDLQLASKEREALSKIRIKGFSDFDAYGPATSELSQKLMEYLDQIGENSSEHIQAIAALIHRLSESVQNGFRSDAIWLTVRVSLPNSEFDTPRWHTDGKYYTTSKKVYKLVAAIKGPGTIFAAGHEGVYAKSGSTPEEHATIYLVGDEEAIVHSEPPISEPRIFLSILPGTIEQINEWRNHSE